MMSLMTPTDEPQAPCRRRLQINDYVIEAKIGVGASSTVFLGVNVKNNCRYALKRIRLAELARSGEAVAGLEREVRMMRMFRHPNILQLIEVLHLPGTDEVYLVLEYADNGCLGPITQKLPQHSVMSIIKQIAQALQYLHEAGYVHQDIKPSNILIDRTGRAVLADFGIGHSFVSASMVVGSPAYQAPEALDDAYGSEDKVETPEKEDVWALGVTLYQLLFQKLPFVGENLFEIIRSIQERPLEIPEGTDPLLANLLCGMLVVDPHKRLGMAEVLEYPLIKNAEPRASDLPPAPLVIIRKGEVEELKADVWGDGASFAEFSAVDRRRASLQRSRFSLSPAVPKLRSRLGTRVSDGKRAQSPLRTTSCRFIVG
jgi:serine/threonine-protein kinase 11